MPSRSVPGSKFGTHLICKFDDLRRLVNDEDDEKKENEAWSPIKKILIAK